jgi:cell division initiation protein
MKITPLDIKKQEFKKVMRGYDPVEVDTFMDMMASEFEELFKQQKELRDKLIELETQLKDYRQIEKSLQQTLLQAQEASGRMYDSARRESEVILKEAEVKAAKILEQTSSDAIRLENELKHLHARKESLIGRLRILLSTELDLIKTLELGDDDVMVGASSHGTGKDSIHLEDVFKSVANDRTP